MRLQKLTLDNVQGHKHTELELGKWTLLTGPTDAGKSSIARALEFFWVTPADRIGLQRKIKGKATPMRIQAEYYDKHGPLLTAERIRSADENSASVALHARPPAKDTVNEEYHNIGHSYPDAWVNIMGAIPVALGKRMVNISYCKQLDKPFLVHETAPDAGRFLGVVSGVDMLDKLTTQVNKEEKRLAQQIKTCQGEAATLKIKLEQAKEKLKIIQDVPALKKELESAENSIKVLKLLEQAYKVRVSLDSLEKTKAILEEVDMAERLLKDTSEVSAQLESLVCLRDHWREEKSLLEKEEKKHKMIAGQMEQMEAEIKEATKDICPVCKRTGKRSGN